MAKIPIRANGRVIQAEPGAILLQVLLDNGIFVPHYCYHPGLSVAGNCRMCLVKVAGRPKLETSCTIRVTAPLEVETEAPEVVAARRDILEFLLINHPLDCPVCDQAGECLLQDFSYTYGRGASRFTENKVLRDSKPLGPLVHYWGNRCILCTRCVRFCDEIAGSGELAVRGRGDHSQIDVFPGRPLDNPLSGNVVDICPVGALLNRDFLYQARVWFLRSTESICTACARGCNIWIDALGNTIRRLRPRPNARVNGWWMCDDGRRSYRSFETHRLAEHRIRGADEPPSLARAVEAARDALIGALQRHGAGRVAAVASAAISNEGLCLFRDLAGRYGMSLAGFVARREGADFRFPGGFIIDADKSPNRNGANWILGSDLLLDGIAPLLAKLRAGAWRALVVLAGDPGLDWKCLPDDLEIPLLIDTHASPLVPRASVVLAAAGWAEAEGTLVNSEGRVQRLGRAINPPGDARPLTELLQRVIDPDGAARNLLSARTLFDRMAAASTRWGGLTWDAIGPGGAVPVSEANAHG